MMVSDMCIKHGTHQLSKINNNYYDGQTIALVCLHFFKEIRQIELSFREFKFLSR